MKSYHTWLWHSPGGRALPEALYSAKGLTFKWNAAIELDVRKRIRESIALLRLPDTEDALLKRFRVERFPELYLKLNQKMRRRTDRSKR
jgi:hypothetical protein